MRWPQEGLEFLILTAARSGEVLGATWSEMDLENAVWTIPAKRMKAGKEHRVPLSPRALAIVKELHETRISDFVFPGQKKDRRFPACRLKC
jgi:integrase